MIGKASQAYAAMQKLFHQIVKSNLKDDKTNGKKYRTRCRFVGVRSCH
jgi:hypothetical protein